MNLESMETSLKRFGFEEKDKPNLAIWLNAAMHNLEDAFDWPWLESKLTEIATASGANTIALPANCLKIITIRDAKNKRKLEYWDRHRFARDVDEPKEVGQPEVYTLISTNQVQLWKVLTEAITFEVLYQCTTPDLVNPTDEPTSGTNVWPPNTHYMIVQCAAAFALQAEDEQEKAKMAHEQYQDQLMKLMEKFGERELDEPTTVQDVQGYQTTTIRRY